LFLENTLRKKQDKLSMLSSLPRSLAELQRMKEQALHALCVEEQRRREQAEPVRMLHRVNGRDGFKTAPREIEIKQQLEQALQEQARRETK
jgi:hypothetical protein